MQSVSDSHLQPHVIPAQQKKSGQVGVSDKTTPAGNSLTLPEDVVSLSGDRSASLDFYIRKKPSVPVSTAETKALRDSFSVYV